MVRTIAVVALVVLIILFAIPLGIGMAMGMCPECPAPAAPHGLMSCAAFATTFSLIIGFATTMLRLPRYRVPVLLYATPFERPPRTA